MRATNLIITGGTFAILTACGGAQDPVDPPVATTQATVVHADSSADDARDTRATTHQAKMIPGVARIAPAQFASFVGFNHGDDRDAATEVLAWKAADLGDRKPLEMTGSEGFRYPGHLAISWSADSKRIDYVSVRSQKAADYLASKGRTDGKLTALLGKSISEARSALGKPTLEADRPHAITYRYDFDAAGKTGTVTLEFDKLEQTPRCKSVSVHWK